MSDAWWNLNYPYRRKIQITAPLGDAPINHPATFQFSTNPYSYGKVRSDLQDIIVVYQGYPISVNTSLGTNLEVIFPLQATISSLTSDTYYVYYGNLNLTSASIPALYALPSWPVIVPADGKAPGISFTRPGEYWLNGVSSMPLSKASLTFFGSKVSAVALTGPNQGIAQVQVDSGAWENVDLFSSTAQNDILVFEQDNLDSGQHFIRYRVSGRKNPASTSSQVNLTQFQYYKYVNGVDLGEEIKPSLIWATHGIGNT